MLLRARRTKYLARELKRSDATSFLLLSKANRETQVANDALAPAAIPPCYFPSTYRMSGVMTFSSTSEMTPHSRWAARGTDLIGSILIRVFLIVDLRSWEYPTRKA